MINFHKGFFTEYLRVTAFELILALFVATFNGYHSNYINQTRNCNSYKIILIFPIVVVSLSQ